MPPVSLLSLEGGRGRTVEVIGQGTKKHAIEWNVVDPFLALLSGLVLFSLLKKSTFLIHNNLIAPSRSAS